MVRHVPRHLCVKGFMHFLMFILKWYATCDVPLAMYDVPPWCETSLRVNRLYIVSFINPVRLIMLQFFSFLNELKTYIPLSFTHLLALLCNPRFFSNSFWFSANMYNTKKFESMLHSIAQEISHTQLWKQSLNVNCTNAAACLTDSENLILN